MKLSSRTPLLKSFGIAALALALVTSSGVAASAATTPSVSADSLTTTFYQANNPRTTTTLISRWDDEIQKASVNNGYTDVKGPVFKASVKAADGLVPVYRMFKKGDFIWVADWKGSNEYSNAQTKYGYESQGLAFYASMSKFDGSVGVERFLSGSKHSYAVSEADKATARAAGYQSEGTMFYVAPVKAATPAPTPAPEPTTPAPTPVPPVVTPAPTPTPEPEPVPEVKDEKFTIALVPDTQAEVFGTDTRFDQRSDYIVANKDKLNIKYAIHTGDVANWGEVDPAQYIIAERAMDKLSANGIPYSIAIGNHDTGAVGVGGGAANSKTTRITVRNTGAFNAAFPVAEHTADGGAFEPGKIDNSFQTFTAGGKKFLVLTLELWPRVEAVEWAKGVVSSHPDYNVIVNTHSYLNGDSSISTSSEYGTTSPKYLYDNLISKYSNIKIVVSGHVGEAGYREDVTADGNKVVSYLNTFHSRSNPSRFLNIDTATGDLSITAYAPKDGATYSQYDKKSNITLVK